MWQQLAGPMRRRVVVLFCAGQVVSALVLLLLCHYPCGRPVVCSCILRVVHVCGSLTAHGDVLLPHALCCQLAVTYALGFFPCSGAQLFAEGAAGTQQLHNP